mgnify:CR=1 FL=1
MIYNKKNITKLKLKFSPDLHPKKEAHSAGFS